MKINDVVRSTHEHDDGQLRTIKKIKSTANGIWVTFYDDDILDEDIWYYAKYYKVV